MDYEYAIMVEAAATNTPQANQMSPSNVALGIGKGLMPLITKVNKGIKKLPKGPWEIVSHNIHSVGNKSVVTFIIRAERP